MTFGAKLVAALTAKAAELGRKLAVAEIEAVANDCFAKEKPPGVTGANLDDEAWLASLEQNPAYAEIDVKREMGKCQAWTGERKRKVTRRSFLSWLNRAEKTIGYVGAGKTSAAPKPLPPKPVYSVEREHPHWRQILRYELEGYSTERTDELCGMRWAELPLDVRQQIIGKQ